MTKKLINSDVKLGENTLLLEALESLGIDFPIEENETYTKWNSGRLEIWLNEKFNGTSGNNTFDFNLPVAMAGAYFNNSSIQATLQSSDGGWAAFELKRAIPVNATTVRVNGVYNRSGEVTVQVYVKAHWK